MKNSILIFSILLFCCYPSVEVAAQVNLNKEGATEVEPGSVRENLKLAKQYYNNEEYEKALVYVDKLIKQKALNLTYEIGFNSYLGLEDYKGAEKFVRKFVTSVRGNNGKYYADLHYLYQKQGKDSKVEKLREEIYQKVNERPNLAYGYADAFQKRGQPQLALDLYLLGEKLIPGASYEYQKAYLYGELGQMKEMYACYIDMVERSPNYLPNVKQLMGRALMQDEDEENVEYIQQLLVEKIQKGGSQSLNSLLIYILIQEEDFMAAFIQLKALDKRQKTNKGDIYKLGKVVANNEEYDLASRIFDYIIDAGSEFPFYESALTLSLENKQNKLLANPETTSEEWKDLQGEYFKISEELKGLPDLGGVAIDLAKISAFQLGETDTAEAVLRKLISTGMVSKEDVARAKIQLADILLYTGNRWDAILLYGQAEKAFEQSPIGQEAKFKRAKAAYYVGDFKWAEGIFDALKTSTSKLIANDAMRYSLLINDNIALDSTMEAMTVYAKADLMYYQDKADSAIRLLDMMEIAFPDHVILDEVLFLKSQILTDKKKYTEAAVVLEALLKDYSDGILADNALFDLALLYEHELGQSSKAQDLYQQLFTEHPDSFFTSEARKRYRIIRGDALVN